MNAQQWESFLWGCTRLNFFFLLLTFVVLLLSEQVYTIHRYFYAGSLAEFQNTLYLTMGIYKLLWIFFNVIPYWVLRQTNKSNT